MALSAWTDISHDENAEKQEETVCAGMAALLAASRVLSACSKKESDAQETRKLIMGTFH